MSAPIARLPDESAKAYQAFWAYAHLLPNERSIDAAWRSTGAGQGQDKGAKRAPSHWEAWSARFDWVGRALALDEAQAALDVAAWSERKRILRERDWSQADQLRSIVDDGLLAASEFIRTAEKFTPASGDKPACLVIHERFDVGLLVRVLLGASKLQRLATGDSTENLETVVDEAALDAMIERGLADLAEARAGQLVAVVVDEP